MSDAQSALAQVREALAAGPTPGPWSIIDDHRGDTWVTCEDRINEGFVEICMVERGFDEPFESEQITNANFIAACSPANMTAILAHVEAQKAGIERLTAERDELRRQLAEAQKELHNLNWALGTEGYDQMATPEEQAEHEAAVRAHHDVLERLEEGKRAYEAMKRDARRYRWLREHVDGDRWYLYYDDCGRDLLQGDALDAAVDAAMGASNE